MAGDVEEIEGLGVFVEAEGSLVVSEHGVGEAGGSQGHLLRPLRRHHGGGRVGIAALFDSAERVSEKKKAGDPQLKTH